MKTSATTPKIIGFRLDEASRQVLLDRAARLSTSPHELARHYVFEALHVADERALLVQTMQSIDQRLMQLRGDVATATEALLASAGKIPAKEAHQWIEETFK